MFGDELAHSRQRKNPCLHFARPLLRLGVERRGDLESLFRESFLVAKKRGAQIPRADQMTGCRLVRPSASVSLVRSMATS